MTVAITQPGRQTLQEIVRHMAGRLNKQGIDVVDMRHAGSLESDVNLPQVAGGSVGATHAGQIERLEGPIVGRPIERRNETKFAWFLDGSQKTLPVWRIGVIPVIVGISAGGILERDETGSCQLLGDTLVERLTWFVPTRTHSAGINRLIDMLLDAGQDVRDPLEKFAGQSSDLAQYRDLAGNYGHLLFYAHQQASNVRSIMEQQLVRYWDSRIRDPDIDKWLVVDGRLPGQYPNAIGIVKDPTSQHLFGDEAEALYSLPTGQRTSAYRLTPPTGQQEGSLGLRNQVLTMWYQRMWPAAGLDARHALIRVEASNEVWEPELIDHIASWLMAERIPRPTRDSRWPTLLYPVHLLELMLKRRINAMTVGWPS